MAKEILISTSPHETKIALLEDGQLVEFYVEREREIGLAGSIYKGRVTRVLPGMQSAFVDVGLERDAFLYVSDFFEDTEEYDKIVSTVEKKARKRGEVFPRDPVPGAAPPPREEKVAANPPAPAWTEPSPPQRTA